MTPLGGALDLHYCLYVASGRLPKLVRKKESMLRAFTVDFFGEFMSCLLLLVSLSSLTDTFLHSCQLEGSLYDCLRRGHKGL